MQTNKSYIEKIDAIEANAVATLAKFGPWFITLPTAWAIGEAAIGHFGWPWWMGGLTGLGIEILGVVVNYTALELFAHNQSRDDGEPGRPFAFAAILAAVYFGAVIVLTAVVENDWLLAAFPILSLVGGVTIGLRIQHGALKLKHAARVQAIAEATHAAEVEAAAAAEIAKAEQLKLQAELQAAKAAEADRKRAEREAQKAAKIAEASAKELQKVAETASEIATEATFLGLRFKPTYSEFAAQMARRNGNAPGKSECLAGIMALGKSERTAYEWYNAWEDEHKQVA